MKRSDIIENIASAIILAEIAGVESPVEKAERILYVIEQAGLGITGDPEEFEPEEGWDAYFVEQDRLENLRDFEIHEHLTPTMKAMAELFLAGKSFEEIAKEYNVARERVRQIIAKCRRVYNYETAMINYRK